MFGKKKPPKSDRSAEERRDDQQDREYAAFQQGQPVMPPTAPTAERRMEIGEAVAQAIITLDHGDIKKFSYLTKDEELTFALWYSIAEVYGLELIRRFINNSLRMRVSIDGQGRQDIVKIASAHILSDRETAQPMGMMGRMRSFVGI